MWIFSKTGFISIVEHRDGNDMMLVRARAAEDIEDFISSSYGVAPSELGITIECDRSADYWYRAMIARDIVRICIDKQIAAIDYDTNFKGNADKDDRNRHRAYMGCWSAMNRFQTIYDRTMPEWDDEDEDDDSASLAFDREEERAHDRKIR